MGFFVTLLNFGSCSNLLYNSFENWGMHLLDHSSSSKKF